MKRGVFAIFHRPLCIDFLLLALLYGDRGVRQAPASGALVPFPTVMCKFECARTNVEASVSV